MSMKGLSRIAVCGLALLLVSGVSSAFAAIEAGRWAVVVYAGNYSPQPDVLDDDATFGVRIAHAITDHIAVAGTLGFYSVEEEIDTGGLTGDINLDVTFLEGSVWYSFRPKKRFNPSVGGGLGGAFGSADGQISGPGGSIIFEDLDGDSFTLHAGFGTTIQLSDSIYLRLNSRWRWYEARDDDNVDQESTLGVAFAWGGQ